MIRSRPRAGATGLAVWLSVFFVAAFAAFDARAEGPLVLRLSSTAPDGTSWARELRAFANEVERLTHGQVAFKIFFGGIAGNELEVQERVRRGQLDAVASGGSLCQVVSPSYRLMRVRGLFNSQEEGTYVLTRLKPLLDEEFKKAGFVHLAAASLGPDILFTRKPVRSLDDLKRQKLWRWNSDDVALLMDREMGLDVVPLPIEDAGRAYDDKQIDGFVAVPAAALAFQWFHRAHYLMDLRVGYIWACLLIANRAFDRLNLEQQQIVQAASAKLAVRMEEVGHTQDRVLLGGLFQRQGLTSLPVPAGLRDALLHAARAARDKLGDKLVSAKVLSQALIEIDTYRAQHPAKEREATP
jgi:TRAP-type C4-dicarboxylate transport system substrate-binding protein